MPNTIRDGKGKGYLAKVTSDNRLSVEAICQSHLGSYAQTEGTAFVAGLHHTTQVADATETVGYFTYTGDTEVVISHIVFTTEEDGGTNTGYTKFGIWRNPTVANGTSRSEINLDFSKSSTLSATIKDNADGAIAVTMTSGDSIGTIRLKGTSTFLYPYYDSLVLKYNNTIGFKASTDTISKKVRVHIFLYEHEEE